VRQSEQTKKNRRQARKERRERNIMNKLYHRIHTQPVTFDRWLAIGLFVALILLVTTFKQPGSDAHVQAAPVAACPSSFLLFGNDNLLPDETPGDGVCKDSAGNCTLRAALMEANALPNCGSLTLDMTSYSGYVPVPAALPTITHPNLIIIGAGPTQMTLWRDSASLTKFRFFTIGGTAKVEIRGMTLENGDTSGGQFGVADGGAMRNFGTLAVRDCVFKNNKAGGNGGGGIANEGTLVLEDSLFQGNTTNFWGGGVGMINGGKATINRCAFVGNHASEGGGIGVQVLNPALPGDVTITNTTISGNTTVYGGTGVFNLSNANGATAVMRLEHCTIVQNQGAFVSGVANYVGGGGGVVKMTMSNTIVAFNVNGPQVGKNAAAELTSLGHNMISDASLTAPLASDWLNTDPKLAPLASHPNAQGGTTFAYALLDGSPALDAGGVSGLTTDQRGWGRPFDLNNVGNAAGSNGSDIGAFEKIACSQMTLPATLPNGLANMAYNASVTASPAGVYSYTVTTNTLPPGLSLNSATGAISGMPTASGNFTFGLTAASAGCVITQAYNLLITESCPALTVNPAWLPAPVVGVAYNQTLSVAGGTAPYSFAITQGMLPNGLTLNAQTGVLSGTVPQGGSYSFRVTATDAAGCTGSRQYTMSVACKPLTFTPATLPSGAKGVAYSQTLTISPAANYTVSLLVGQLPPGFTMNSTGVISGLTSQAGTYIFTVKALAANAGGCQGTKSYSLVIN
jgi:hypothetical protein